MSPPPRLAPSPFLAPSWRAAVVALLVLGVGYRVAPLLDHGDRMLWQWPTEDGYLMMTIARNLALGRGMTIADGAIATNGTQPLTTFVWAALFGAVGGDKRAGVLLVQVWQILASLGAAALIHAIGAMVLRERPWGRSAAALAAGAWFASPVVMDRTMNGLETGTYLLLLLLAALTWLRWEERRERPFQPGIAAGIGALLGLVFLARIDAVFFIASVTALHVLAAGSRAALPRRLGESTLMGLASIAVASPWLLHNLRSFGSVMPISGTAQSAAATLGSNLPHVPGALFEYATMLLPVPSTIELTAPVLGLTSAASVAYAAALVFAARRASRGERVALALGGLTGLALVVYYGLLFGAPHFVARYLFPVTPLLALATSSAIAAAAHRLLARRPRGRATVALGLAGAVALTTATGTRLYLAEGRGSAVDHRAVMRWVTENVPEETWVAAVQTGVLGFFHDRTINLDGKVNPQALAARLARRTQAYVVDLPVAYVVDWAGLASWIELEPMDRHFELVVHDRARNVAVLRRVTPIPVVADVGLVRGAAGVHARPVPTEGSRR